ncbi:hypothetical protein FRC00_003629 [Tulasnella sp. 408]|nr:hypothetical protein FRC00_003629 [Tulasnella sp. 408]
MSSASESAPIETFANLTLNEDGINTEGEALGEESDRSDFDGYSTTDPRSEKIYSKLFKAIHSTDRDFRLKATIKIRRLLASEGKESVQAVIDSGVLPTILDMLASDDPEFLSEATWILVNITAGSSEQTSQVVEAGALPKLISLFPTSSNSVKENILMTVGNIMGDSKHLRQGAIQGGGFELALDVLHAPEDHSAGCLESAAWAVATALTLDCGDVPDDRLVAKIILVLTTFIRNQGDDVSEPLTEAVRALRQLSIHRDVKTAIRDSGVTHQIIGLCTEKDKRTREDALRLAIHMGGGDESSAKALLQASALDYCAAQQAKRRESALEDIAPPRSQALTELPLLPRILQVLSGSTDPWRLRSEAAGLTLDLEHIATRNLEIFDLMVEASYLEALSRALLSDDSDRLEINLQALEQILNAKWGGRQRVMERFEASDGPRRLRDLRVRRHTRKTAASGLAQTILRTHFPEFSKSPRV